MKNRRIGKVKNRDNRGEIIKRRYPEASKVLSLLAGGAFLSLVILVPVLPIALKPFLGPWEEFDFGQLRKHLKRFKKDGLVEIGDDNGGGVVKLTQIGKEKFLISRMKKEGIMRPKKWDEKWRLVLYDIPDEYKKARDFFCSTLKIAGFLKLQESVFICPFDCLSEIEILRTNLGLSNFVKFIVADRVEDEDRLKAIFKL